MKMEKYCFILVLVIGFLCAPVLAEAELAAPNERPLLIDRANQQLAGIGILCLDIVMPEAEAKKNSLAWEKLKDKAKSELEQADIEVTCQFYKEYEIRCPRLRVDIEMLALEDSHQYILRIQTSLARAVYLAKHTSWAVVADVWKSEPVMQVISVQDMPPTVTNLALEQVKAFIGAYRLANSQLGQLPDVNDTIAVPATTSGSFSNQATIDYKYVASKNSQVFHKPDCRWAKNISMQNLVGYNTMEQAIEAGKKPCRWCKP